jgi:hypothetical protein
VKFQQSHLVSAEQHLAPSVEHLCQYRIADCS